MARVTFVLFDLDDTLFAHRDSLRRGFAAHLAAQTRIVVADLEAELARWGDLEEEHYARYLTGELDWHGQRRERVRAFLAPHGVRLPSDVAADSWFAEYRVQYEAAWVLHDDVIPCLDAMPDARLGIIANGELDSQTGKVAAIGLSSRIQHIVASSAVGVTKPDPAIFVFACDLFGVAPEEAWYVGDRLETDAVGARSAGLRGVWLDRSGSASPAERARASALDIPVIHSLGELPALVRSSPTVAGAPSP